MAKIFIEETSLTAIGDAIREKTGSSELLTVPSGMVEAIAAIETGGGGSSSSAYVSQPVDVLTLRCNNVSPWHYSNAEIVDIPTRNLFSGSKIFSIDLPNLKTIGGNSFGNGQETFYQCWDLVNVNLPSLEKVYGSTTFSYCQNLKYINLPKFKEASAYMTFQYDNQLRCCVLPSCTNLNIRFFSGCTNLRALVLANETMTNLESTNVFEDVPVTGSTGLYIYVPSALVDTYKAATNWATFADRIRAIEGSEFENADKWIGHVTAEETTVYRSPDSSVNARLTGLSAPNATEINARDQINLVYVDAPKVSYISGAQGGGFYGCSSLLVLKMPKLSAITTEGLSGCSALEKLVFSADKKTSIHAEALKNCSALATIVLPHQGAVASLGTQTGINANLTYYVPSSLLANYQETYPNFTFATIEDHPEVL